MQILQKLPQLGPETSLFDFIYFIRVTQKVISPGNALPSRRRLIKTESALLNEYQGSRGAEGARCI